MTDSKGNLGQFKDPWGLAWRMVTSGDKQAFWALLQLAATVGLTPVDLLLRPVESKLVRSSEPCGLPLVFVVGAPRSGSTLIYQVLARYLDVCYFTNLSSLFPRSTLAASALLRALGRRPSADFQSYYGNTAGFAAPNDAFHVWNRWLGSDRYRVPDSLPEAAEEDMRRFFSTLVWRAGKPFLNKNNRNTSCVPLIASILENSRFVVVHRDPVLVVQSLLLARQRIQGDRRLGWGLASRDLDSSAGWADIVDEVCRQVERIDQGLDEARQKIADDRFVDIDYEDFCAHPQNAVRKIQQRVPGVSLRSETALGDLRPLRASTEIRLADHELRRIQERFA